MARHVALLRGINVGGNKKVSMATLREMATALGLTNAQTLLQSGNLLFESARLKGAALEKRLEQQTEQRLGVTCDYVIRTADEWNALIAANPFPREADSDPGHLLVMCLKDIPAEKQVQELRAAIKGPELVHSAGKQLYLVYPAGVGTSKLTGAVIERTIGCRGTARNWNTVLKIAALCDA